MIFPVTSNGGYAFFQEAIIGIEPNRGLKGYAELWINDIFLPRETYKRKSATDPFDPIDLQANIKNCGNTSFSGFVGFSIYKDGKPVGYGGEQEIELEPYQSTVVESDIALLSDLPSGTYTIRAVYKNSTTDIWEEIFGMTMVYLSISDTILSFTPFDSTHRLQVNSVDIEGHLVKGNDFIAIVDITNIGGGSDHWVEVRLGDFADLIDIAIDPGENAKYRVRLRVNEEGEQNLVVKLGDDTIWSQCYMIEPLTIVTDEQYINALNAIKYEKKYMITTMWNDRKYYLTTEGYLTTKDTEAGVFSFHRTEGDDLYRSPGWKLDECFSNPKLSEGATGLLSPQGHILTDKGYNRISWEGQVWYLNEEEGLYAVRSTNANSDMWGAATYWTVLDTDSNNQPEADYSWEPAFLWQVELPPTKIGDVNSDCLVNVQDATLVVNYILGNVAETAKDYNYSVADMNADSEVDVFDVTAMIGAILSEGNAAKARRMKGYADVASEDLTLAASIEGLTVNVADAGRFTSFQMDVEAPRGVKVTGARLTANGTDHIVKYAQVGENRYRVMAISMGSTPLAASADGLLEVNLSDGGDVTVDGILFVTAQGEAVRFAAQSLNTATGIADITSALKDGAVYDLSGRKVNAVGNQLPKGVYIVNQKKVVVK